MSARDDRLAAESAERKVARAAAEARREWLAAHPDDPAQSADARARRLSEALGLDSPLRRPMTREEQERSRHPGGRS